jgi:hypothetical protein
VKPLRITVAIGLYAFAWLAVVPAMFLMFAGMGAIWAATWIQGEAM